MLKGMIVLFIITLGLVFLGVDRMFWLLKAHDESAWPKPKIVSAETLPPPPRLQIHGDQELQAYRQAQALKLGSYGWIDQKTARIPITRAMEILANEKP